MGVHTNNLFDDTTHDKCTGDKLKCNSGFQVHVTRRRGRKNRVRDKMKVLLLQI